ncbi:unnamed protein product [Gordionus sp. m RMFG-2023]
MDKKHANNNNKSVHFNNVVDKSSSEPSKKKMESLPQKKNIKGIIKNNGIQSSNGSVVNSKLTKLVDNHNQHNMTNEESNINCKHETDINPIEINTTSEFQFLDTNNIDHAELSNSSMPETSGLESQENNKMTTNILDSMNEIAHICDKLSQEEIKEFINNFAQKYNVPFFNLQCHNDQIKSLEKRLEEKSGLLVKAEHLTSEANSKIEQLKRVRSENESKLSHLEQSSREKMLSLTQDLQIMHSRVGELQSFQAQENKRFQELISARDNDIEGLEQSIYQTETKFQSEMATKCSTYDDKLSKVTKQLELLTSQNSMLEQDKVRLKMELYEKVILSNDLKHQLEMVKVQQNNSNNSGREGTQSSNGPLVANGFKNNQDAVNHGDNNMVGKEDKYFGEILKLLNVIKSNIYLKNNSEQKVVSHSNNQGAAYHKEIKDFKEEVIKGQSETMSNFESLTKSILGLNEIMEHFKGLTNVDKFNQTCIESNDLKRDVKMEILQLKEQINAFIKEYHDGYDKALTLDIEAKEELKNIAKTLVHTQPTMVEYDVENYVKSASKASSSQVYHDDNTDLIASLKDKNNELRTKNWKLMEALTERESRLARSLKGQTNNTLASERENVLKILKDLSHTKPDFASHKSLDEWLEQDFSSSGKDFDKMEANLFFDSCQSYLSNLLNNPVTDKNNSNSTLEMEMVEKSAKRLKNLELLNQTSTNELGCIKAANKKLQDEIDLLKENKSTLTNQLISTESYYKKFCDELNTRLIEMKAQNEDKESRLEDLSKISFSKHSNNYAKLTLSEPFFVEILEETTSSSLKSNNSHSSPLIITNKKSNSDMKANRQSASIIDEPWIEVMIEPFADTDLLKELEIYKTKIQDMQRELISLQSLNEGQLINVK